MLYLLSNEQRKKLWKYFFVKDYFYGRITNIEFLTHLSEFESTLLSEKILPSIIHDLRQLASEDLPESVGMDLNFKEIIKIVKAYPHNQKFPSVLKDKALVQGKINKQEYKLLMCIGTGSELAVNLVEAIKYGAISNIVKPRYIWVKNIIGQVSHELEQLEYSLQHGNTILLQKINNPLAQRFGVRYMKGRILLYPTIPETNINGEEQNYLEHVGTLIYLDTNSGRTNNNLENLRTHGVFGSPETNIPTYLMSPASHVANFEAYRRSGSSRIDLMVDKKILLEKRNIFVDPETIEHIDEPVYLLGDQLGNSYFVLGGIPKEAIISFHIY